MKNFKRITKRGLSLFVALLMCMSVMSLTAFAEDEVTTEPEPIETVEPVDQVTEPAGETQDPVEVVEPVEDETPVEDEAPAEDPAPVEEEDPAEDPAPAEDEAPAEDPAPAEDETPAEDPDPAEEELTDATAGQLSGIALNGIAASNQNGSYVVALDGSTQVTACTLAVTADAPMSWSVTTPAAGDLYVSSVSADGNSAVLNFNITAGTVDLKDSQYALTLTANADKTVWTGSFGTGFTDYTLVQLADLLGGQTVQLAANAMNGDSEARRFLVNHYDGSVQIALCAPGAAIYTVTYQTNSSVAASVKLAAGMTVPVFTPALAEGQSFLGWFDQAEGGTQISDGTAVTKDLTLYAHIQSTVTNPQEQFIEDLKAGVTVTIGDLDTWNLFVANASQAVEGGLVRLTNDINCGGASYTSMTFAGSFDGGGNTISNATFTPATGKHFNGETVDCCGMFASIGPGQVVANLNLDSITASSSTTTYSGALAGVVDGYPPKAIVQNVHVTNCTVRGRSAGGVAGFCRHANIFFCSSESSTIGGLANGGGIIGLVSDDSLVQNCYSKCSPTALSFMGGKAGGIGGKVVRSGNVNLCWCTDTTVVNPADGGSATNNLGGVNDDTKKTTFTNLGFSETYWSFAGIDTTFKEGANISYPFSN